MSGHGRDWAELASQRERLIGGSSTSGWTELASRNERLVEPGDPHFRLTSPAQHAPVRVAAATKDRLAG
jgi:hypothetical protein